ncbi:MAG: DUF4157 domain-containing protein [Acidobacteriaceae bacterium]
MSRALLARKADAKAAGQTRVSAGGLKISQPGDAFECEADRIAQEAMTGATAPTWSFSGISIGTLLQRKCSCGGSAGSDGECAECKEKKEPTLQRKASGCDGSQTAPQIVHNVLRSPGQPLDRSTRHFFERRFGHDFSDVRVHRGARESESAQAVNALAYTVGQHIVLGPGSHSTQGFAGNRLLAHELAHTIQQSDGDLRTATRLLRLTADKSAIPPGLTCVTDPSPGSGAEAVLTDVKITGLITPQKKQIAEYYKLWVAGGSKDFIAVDGYASPDSANDSANQQKANWRYSCNRAEMVQAEFVRLGVPRSRVITFSHGETDQFSASQKDPGPNRRVEISRVSVAPSQGQAPAEQPVQGPTSIEVKGKSDGDKATINTKPAGGAKPPAPVAPSPAPTEQPKAAPSDSADRVLSLTFEFDLKNDWKSPKPPTSPQKSPFLCDHGIYQLGLKWNDGIRIKKDVLELGNEPELDINFGDPNCGQNPAVTFQTNLLKYTILKDVIEADLVGVFGLPDGWARGFTHFPFTGGGQIKLQFTPFARISPDFKGLKIGAYGGLSFERGVDIPGAGEESPSRVWTVGGFIGLDYDIGPKKKEKD